jgi:hypothetical protein
MADDFETPREDSKSHRDSARDDFTTPRDSVRENFTTPRDSVRDNFATPRDSARDNFATPRDSTRDGGSLVSARDDFSTPRAESKSTDSALHSKEVPYAFEENSSEYNDNEGYMGYYSEEVSQDKDEAGHADQADIIFSAARHNRVSEVESMIDSGMPIDIRDAYGNTLLAVACQNGLKKMAKCVLRRGAE